MGLYPRGQEIRVRSGQEIKIVVLLMVCCAGSSSLAKSALDKLINMEHIILY